MKRVLITGASGFIGKCLMQTLSAAGYRVRAAVRCLPDKPDTNVDYFECGTINARTDWHEGLKDIYAVVHLAGRPDSMDTAADSGAAPATVTATLAFANAAAVAKVKKFIYISSIKVNGEDSGSCPYTADQEPAPENSYAVAKYATEKALLSLSVDMSVTVIRPPLVYGPGAKGNFALLKRAIVSGIPLPLAGIDNKRSLVSVFNLCDFIKTCIDSERIDKEVFLVSDGQDLSTPALIRMLAAAMHRKARLFYFPQTVLRLLAALMGKRGIADRLYGNLQVDIDKNQRVLGWSPPFTVENSLQISVGE